MKVVLKQVLIFCLIQLVYFSGFSQQKDTLNIEGNLFLIKSDRGDQIYNQGIYINQTTRYGSRELYPKSEVQVKIEFKEKLDDKLLLYEVSGQDNGLLLLDINGSSGAISGTGTYDKISKGVNKYNSEFLIYTEKNGKQGLILGTYERLKPIYDKVEFEERLGGPFGWISFKILNEGYEEFYLYNFDNFSDFGGNTFEYYFPDKKHSEFVHISYDGRSGLGSLNSGKILVGMQYDEVRIDSFKELAFVINKSKIGIADLNRAKVLFEPEYDNVDLFGTASPYNIVTRKDGKYGFIEISTFTKNVIQATYDRLFYSSCNDRIMFSENGKYGLIDKKERVIVPAEYDDIYPFTPNKKVPSTCSRSLFAVKKGDYFAPYSIRKGELDKFVYDTVESVKEYAVVLSGNGKTYSFDKDGKKTKLK